MDLFFKDPRTVLRMREGPLDQYIDSYTAEIRAEGYTHNSAVLVPIHPFYPGTNKQPGELLVR